MEIEQLVKLAATGDQRAWRALVERLEPKLRSWFAKHYCGAEDDELIQETLIVIASKLAKFELRHEHAFMGWVFRIARFVRLEALRDDRNQRKVVGALGLARKTPSTGLITRIDRADKKQLVQAEIEKLPGALCRAAQNMLDGGNAKELAEQAGLDWGTVRGYESRAIGLLRERLRTPSPAS